MRKKLGEPSLNMTPMIDVVFQMIIFFVCTAQLEQQQFDEAVQLEWARDGQAIEDAAPLTVQVNVRRDGAITIGGALMDRTTFRGIMRNTVRRYGAANIPVVIRGDRESVHGAIRDVMDICKEMGIWRVSFAAIKEQG